MRDSQTSRQCPNRSETSGVTGPSATRESTNLPVWGPPGKGANRRAAARSDSQITDFPARNSAGGLFGHGSQALSPTAAKTHLPYRPQPTVCDNRLGWNLLRQVPARLPMPTAHPNPPGSLRSGAQVSIAGFDLGAWIANWPYSVVTECNDQLSAPF